MPHPESQEERWKPAGSLCFREPQTRLIGPSSGVTLDASVHPVSRNFGGLLSTPGPQGFLNPQNIEKPPMILCDLRGESTQVALEDKKRKSCLRAQELSELLKHYGLRGFTKYLRNLEMDLPQC
ncbi:unnamed protein product [Caretta caretta]